MLHAIPSPPSTCHDPHSLYRTSLVDSSGTLESQLEAVKVRELCQLRSQKKMHTITLLSKCYCSFKLKAREIDSQKDDLKHIEELGAKVEEALIFDNK